MTDLLSQKQVFDALRLITDKKTGQNLVDLGVIQHVHVTDTGGVRVVMELPAADMKDAPALKTLCEKELALLKGVTKVDILLAGHRASPNDSQSRTQKSPHKLDAHIALPHIQKIIAVASGKGGVGKSLVAVNLAFALQQKGAKVGLLDLDIYGPSIPLMTGCTDLPQKNDNRFVPLERAGVKILSMGCLIPPEKAAIWRGPLVQMAVQQLLRDTSWGSLDYLILDTPPGTGDVHLTLTQTVTLTGVIIVTTPQEIALIDARKSSDMFQTVGVPVLGLVENMADFACPCCGEENPLYIGPGVRVEAEKLGVPLLASVPFSSMARTSSDTGMPLVLQDPLPPSGACFEQMADKLLSG